MSLKQKYNYLAPSLTEKRNRKYLLIWEKIGKWMVVDKETIEFLSLFDGEKELAEVVQLHIKRFKKEKTQFTKEALQITKHFLKERILLPISEKAASNYDDKISISNITYNITNACNLKCIGCYNNPRNLAEIPTETIVQSIRKSAGDFSKNATFNILGGEPFLQSEKLINIVDSVGDCFLSPILISTNGTLITDKTASDFSKRKVEIQISLDSHDAQINDTFRGKGSFKKALSGIKKLVEAGCYTIISMVYTQKTYLDFENYLDLAKKLGLNEARFIPFRAIGSGLKLKDKIPDQYKAYLHFASIIKRRPDLHYLIKRDYFSIAQSVCKFSANRINCGLAYKVLFIDADGSIYPCPNFVEKKHLCGNIQEKSLHSIMKNSAVMKHFRAKFILPNYKQCKKCTFKHWCAGDCRGEVVSLTDSATNPSPHCLELQKMYVDILWDLSKQNSIKPLDFSAISHF